MPNDTNSTTNTTDQNNTNPTDNNTNSNDQQNSDVPNTKSLVVGCDSNNGNDSQAINTVSEGLKQAGYEVEQLEVGPSPFSAKAYTSDAKGKIGIYLMAASLFSFADGTHDLYDYDIFCIRGDASNINSQEKFDSSPISNDPDCNSVCDEFTGMTYPQMNEKAKGKCVAVYGGQTAEEFLQAILNALNGINVTGGQGTVSGGSAQVKDKTFEDCIKRICAATDSVFIVENNAAVLFPYTDWMAFTLRQQINTIKKDKMDPDFFSIDYNTDGFYNKVTTVYGAEEEEAPIESQATTDESNNTNVETTSDGQVTKTRKSMPKGGTRISKQYDSLVEIYGELEKQVTTNFPDEETAEYVANALLIQYIRDFNNSCNVRCVYDQNYIGGTFYHVENVNDDSSNLYYLNSYVVFKEKNQPITIDFEFKYGPEGAEELLDYQNYGGNSNSSGGAGGTPGGESADINQLAQQICQGLTDDIQKMTAIHNYLKDHITYGSYECTQHDTPSKCLQDMGHLNCADTSRLTRALMSAAGLNAEVVHGDYHFWTIITINGKEYASDAVSSYHAINEVWSSSSHHNTPFGYFEKCGKNPSC